MFWVILVDLILLALALIELMPAHSTKYRGHLVFVDTETTGLTAGWHEIIEICAIRVCASTMRVVGSMYMKIKPDHMDRAHPKALEVNGYTDEAWSEALPLSVVLEMLSPLLSGALMIGHNVSFDKDFIRAAYKQAHIQYPRGDYHTLDTVSLAWPLKLRSKVRNLKLATLCDYFGISNKGEHSAYADVIRTIKVYLSLVG